VYCQKRKESQIYSIIVPCFNEGENVKILAGEISSLMNQYGKPWECIWVDDCSLDETWKNIGLLDWPNRGLRLERNSGQSTAIMAGIDHAKFETIITLDGDLQNDPRDIPSLISLFDEGFDIVSGVRVKREDAWLRKFFSKLANTLSRKITSIAISDLGCTLRIFKRSLLQETRLFGEMHRVLVIHLVLNGASFAEIDVNHRPRIHGRSKYGYIRIFKFIADVILAKSWQTINKKPLYLFASAAFFVFALSILLFGTAIGFRVLNIKAYIDTSLISSSVILFATSLILLSIGLISEAMMRQNHVLGVVKQYRVAEQVDNAS
jgi:glycosyltransferase involved in cell wall biosynthesis